MDWIHVFTSPPVVAVRQLTRVNCHPPLLVSPPVWGYGLREVARISVKAR
jgi:hypothetical protein